MRVYLEHGCLATRVPSSVCSTVKEVRSLPWGLHTQSPFSHKMFLKTHWDANISHLSLKNTQVDMVTSTHTGFGPQSVPGVDNSPGLEIQFWSDPFLLSPCAWSWRSHYTLQDLNTFAIYSPGIILAYAFEVVIRFIRHLHMYSLGTLMFESCVCNAPTYRKQNRERRGTRDDIQLFHGVSPTVKEGK